MLPLWTPVNISYCKLFSNFGIWSNTRKSMAFNQLSWCLLAASLHINQCFVWCNLCLCICRSFVFFCFLYILFYFYLYRLFLKISIYQKEKDQKIVTATVWMPWPSWFFFLKNISSDRDQWRYFMQILSRARVAKRCS